ncbi:MAG: hypothetical protein JXR62_06590 [Bacilli bacterium]|nr:hypothetical protein [Bacilli bacterium]
MVKQERFQFMKQIFKFLFLMNNLILGFFVIGFLIFIYQYNYLYNSNDNYTWIYSASMQTLAALIALLPISFSYYLHKIEDQKSKEFDSYILKKLEKDVYYEMMFVIMFSLLSIIINLGSLFFRFNYSTAVIATGFTLFSVQFVVIYIYRLFDPDRVFDILKEFDVETEISTEGTQKIVTLDEFITIYLQLETVVKDYISNENDNSLIDKLPLYDIVDNLSKDFPVLEEYYKDFKEIIFHRNNLIHNYNEVTVDYNKYSRILELIKVFEKYNDQFISDKIFSNVSAVKNIIEIALTEYSSDYRNKDKSVDNIQISTYEEDVSSLLQSYFISDYYETLDFEESEDMDFEIIQNNYSNRKLLGIDFKMTDSKNFKILSKPLLSKLMNKYLYIFIINYDLALNQFEVHYLTKDKKQRSDIFKIK